MSKPTYHHGDLRTALLHAATEMIRESGTESVTMRALAQRIGVSRTAPYRHFADKAALLAAVAMEGYERMATVMADVRQEESADCVARLQKMGQAYVVFAVENAAHYQLMFGDSAIHHNATPELREANLSASRQLADAIIDCQANDRIVDAPARQIGNLLWSMVHGLAMLIISGQMRVDDVREAARFMTESTCNGLIKTTVPLQDESRRGTGEAQSFSGAFS